jgi:hypothetical protein
MPCSLCSTFWMRPSRAPHEVMPACLGEYRKTSMCSFEREFTGKVVGADRKVQNECKNLRMADYVVLNSNGRRSCQHAHSAEPIEPPARLPVLSIWRLPLNPRSRAGLDPRPSKPRPIAATAKFTTDTRSSWDGRFMAQREGFNASNLRYRANEFTGKRVLVTGVTKRIGEATVSRLSRGGYRAG